MDTMTGKTTENQPDRVVSAGLVGGLAGGLAFGLMMGMGLQFGAALSGPMLLSLAGHLVYGAVTGLVFAWYTQR